MTKFKIEILETTNIIVEVDANDLGDAIESIRERYESGDIVLNPGTLGVGCDVEFTAI
ncbi:hypothetical protein LCGC14_1000360 [marine sediment metagenome]|uniref:DpnD/PcfM-like C-terminal domain-containing protein n=1 Tax=marine sediment metagenome TaxID=412755 RepID=A0A0F9N3A0_9ZZZZ